MAFRLFHYSCACEKTHNHNVSSEHAEYYPADEAPVAIVTCLALLLIPDDRG
jgi:hypothetical protein